MKVLRWIEDADEYFYTSSLKTHFLQENSWKNFMDILKLSYENMPFKRSSMDKRSVKAILLR